MSFDKLYFGFIDMDSLISGGLGPTLIVCLIICPGIPFLLGAVLDGYWVPIRSEVQFFAFWPGNLCLALFIAFSFRTFQTDGFSIHPAWNVVVFVVMLGFYVALNLLDVKSHYTKGQLRSAMKIYHNLLYFWYGYLAIASFIAMWGTSVPLDVKLRVTLIGLAWAYCMKLDNDASAMDQAMGFQFAHVESIPIWKSRGRIRRLVKTPTGYAYVYKR